MRFAPSIVLAALLLPPCPARCAQPGPVTVNGIAVKVNGTVITLREIEDEIDEKSMRLLSLQYGRQPAVFQQQVEKLRSDTVQLLVERQLILDEFKTGESAGHYKFPENYINEEMKRRIRDRFGDRVRMIKTLQEQGITYEAYRQRLKEEFIINAMEYKNVGSEQIVVSPHKIETYYAQHPDKFRVDDQVKLRMIFLANRPDRDAEATKKRAEEILAEIKGGASFAEKASAESEDSYKSEGGLRPAEDRKTLREDLAKAAFQLKPGELSDVLELKEGCYLMKVEEFHPAHLKPLNEVRAEIEKTLELEDRGRLRKEWIERLKAKAFIYSFTAI